MTPEFLIVNAIVAFAAYVQTTTGVGFAMIAVPTLVLIDLSYAPGPALLVMLFLAVAMVAGSWRNVDTKGFTSLLPGLLVGTLLGSRLLGVLTPNAFGVVFGLMVLTALVVVLIGSAPSQSRAVNAGGGFASGLMGTVSGIHGPPLVVIYQKSEHAAARATIAFVFVIASSLSLVSLHRAGHFGQDEVVAGLTLLPGLVVGFVVASTGRRFVSDGVARNVMLLIAAISATVLIVRSIV